jgi:Ni/Co efflux regulator RcnB
MNMKSRSLLAVAVALSLALPGIASADRRGHDRHDYHGDRHGNRQGHGYKKHHRDRYPVYRNHRYYPNYRGYRDGHITRYYDYDNDDDDLLTGLLVGGVLGYIINGAQHSNPYYYYDR